MTDKYKRPPVVCLMQPCTDTVLPKLVLYFHGVGENISQVDGEMRLLSRSLRANVIVIEYPGYGMNWNDGICTE